MGFKMGLCTGQCQDNRSVANRKSESGIAGFYARRSRDRVP